MCKWEKVKLGDVVTFQRGHDLPKNQMKNGKYPVIGSSGIIGYHDEFTTKEPSITIGRSGHSVGKPFLFKGISWSHNTTLYIKDFKNNNPCFVFYLLQTLKLNHYSGGSAIPTLNRNHIHTIPVLLPPLEEQNRIAAILSSLDDKIEVNSRINKNLEEQAQAIFKSWFVDFEPFGGVMPKDWREGTLWDICAFNENSYNTKEDWNCINYLDTSSITKNCISEIQQLDVSRDKVPSRAKRKVKANDIIFSTVRPNQQHYGIIKTPIENMLVSTGFTVISARQNISYHRIYLQITTKDSIEHLNTIAEQSTSTFPAIKAEDISCLDTYVLPQKIETSFFNIMEPIFEKIELCNIESQRLCEVRNALIPKLMNGEISAII